MFKPKTKKKKKRKKRKKTEGEKRKDRNRIRALHHRHHVTYIRSGSWRSSPASLQGFAGYFPYFRKHTKDF